MDFLIFLPTLILGPKGQGRSKLLWVECPYQRLRVHPPSLKFMIVKKYYKF